MFRQERGALMAADGFSRLNNRETFGVVITQGGPGAENAMGGLAQAYGDNVPILYFAGGPALDQQDVRPNFSPVRTYQTVSIYGERSSGSPTWSPASCAAPSTICATVGRSRHRRGARRRRHAGSSGCIVFIPAAQALSRRRPAPAPCNEAVRLLLAAKKPLIWSGMGTLMAAGQRRAARARRAAGNSRVLHHAGQVGLRRAPSPGPGLGQRRHGPARAQVDSRSVTSCMALGSSLTRTGYGQPIPDGKIMIHNTESIEDIDKDYSVEVGLPGDTKLTIQMLVEEVKGQLGENGRKGQSNVAAEIAEIKQQWLAEWTALLNSDEVPINTYRVIGELERHARQRDTASSRTTRARRATPSCRSSPPPSPTATSAGARRRTWATASP